MNLYANVIYLLFLSEKEKEDIFVELEKLEKIISGWKVNYIGDSYKYIINEDVERFLDKVRELFSRNIIICNDEQMILSMRKLLILGNIDRLFATLRVLLYSTPRIWRTFDSMLGILELRKLEDLVFRMF